MRILLASFPQFAVLLCLVASGLHAAENPCIITTIAGGAYVPTPDGVLATDAEFAFAEDIQHAPDGSVYIADSGHATIRRIRLDGTIERVAGNGTRGSSPDGTPAREAQIDPRRLAFDAQGALLFTDGYSIRTITPDGKLATIAGNGSYLFSGDGGQAVDAGIGWHPLMALEADGSLLIAASQHGRIRRITPDGVIQTMAGRAELFDGTFSSSGDGGPAIDANLGHVFSLAVSPDGSIYFYGVVPGDLPEMRRIRTDGIVEPHPSPIGSIGDIAFDAAGNLFVSGLYVYRYESGSWVTVYDRRIAPDISVSPGGELLVLVDDQVFRIENNAETLVAGAGDKALHGDGGPADQAFIGRATGIAIAADSSVYFVDQSFDRVRRITPSGVLEFFAGAESNGFRTVSGLAPSIGLASVDGVVVSPDGVVYVSGQFQVINQSPGPQSLIAIELDGAISTVPVVEVDGPPLRGNSLVDLAIGIDGVPSYTTGFPGSLFLASLDRPSASPLHESATGQFAIAPDGSAVIGTSQAAWRRILPDGEVTVIPGLTDYFLQSDTVAVGPDGSIYWTDYLTGLWRMAADLAIDRIAGGHDATDPGDGVAAADAELRGVNEMSFGPNGDLYLALGDRIRKITAPSECPSAGPRPKIASFGVTNAASYSSIAPGAVFALFGLDIGPAEMVSAALENDGTLPTELGGTRVLFDGVPAPLLFSSKGQVNGIVPFGTKTLFTSMVQVTSIVQLRTETPILRVGDFSNQGFVSVVAEYKGVQSNENIVTAYSAQPAIFTLDASGSGLGAILNSNGTLNGPDNPAVPGSIIVMWATGAGVMTPAQADGSITAGPTPPQPVTPIGLNIGGLPATLAYAGAAPGLAAGVIQVNAYIPPGLTQTGEVTVQIYSDAFPNSLNSVTVYVGGDD